MGNRLVGKRALVTGGTRGIGHAIAERMAAEGALVVATGRGSEVEPGPLAATSAEVSFRHLEITNEDEWQDLVDSYADTPFNVLVNNAGGLRYPKSIGQTTPAEWREEVEVNLTGPFLGIRALLPMMRKSGGGSIINIGSMSGIRAQPDAPGYQSSKAGLDMLSRHAAMSLAEARIRVNTLSPGVIATSAEESLPEERELWFYNRIPMVRKGSPLEVADAAVFLASDEASYVTGANICVDGGYVL